MTAPSIPTEDLEAVTPAIDPDGVAPLEERPVEPEETDATASDPILEPIYLDRHKSPTNGLLFWAVTQLEARRTRITGVIVDDEGTHWDGVQVVPWPDVLAIFGGSIPQPHPLSAEIADGGDLYVILDCPKCDVTVRAKAEVDVEFKLRGREGGVAQLKPVFKAKARTHVCGQQELPLPDAPGQTEAFPEPTAEPARTAPIPQVPLEDVVRLLDRLEREERLVDRPEIGIPPEEEIARWSPDDLGLVYEWAWAEVHQEPERPPVPAVLLRGGSPDDGPAVETPLGEEIDGGAGTGDPDGDLLP